jgi:signal transduction histidine kinase
MIMIKYFFFLLVLLPLGLMGQSSGVQLLDKNLNEGWMLLDEGWKYQKGDDLHWAQPSYDDKQWELLPKNSNLNRIEGTSIAGDNEIAWFRKKVKVDSFFTESVIFSIEQTGASEIFLDGKLLYTFGVVSGNPATFLQKSAGNDIFLLPLESGKEQLLAVRYAAGSRDFPLYNNLSSQFSIRLTTVAVLNSPDLFRNNVLTLIPPGFVYFLINLGSTSLISILFFTLFLFFPKERLNGYFALSTFCMSFWIIINFNSISIESYHFWPNLFSRIFLWTGISLMLFCIYRIFERTIGFWFWTICFLFLLSMIASVVYPIDELNVAVYFYLITIIVLSIRSLKTNRTAALIFIYGMGLTLVYFFIGILLNALAIDSTTYDVYGSGLSFMILPLSIAIYLGYSFSQRSKSLEVQLQEVKKLSTENTKILSEQKSTLEKEVSQRTKELNDSLENLKSTQSQLIQSEKMASLGELTAGIAHEIQNPLNFVNNFSEVSEELIDEMNEELDKGDIEEAKAISVDIKQNLEKINHHGKRADSIVKGMLAHSRSGKGEKTLTDLNALSEEYLKLSYHGLRARDKSFNADFKTDFDFNLLEIDVVPQDLGRVVLNLVTNAFYAVNEKAITAKTSGDIAYKPLVSIATKKKNNSIEITVTDNGNGIPEQVLDKIFQPFFTTKPTGQGTGLGLSLSYDVVKAHGGVLRVESTVEEGNLEAQVKGEGQPARKAGTIFIIELPIINTIA